MKNSINLIEPREPREPKKTNRTEVDVFDGSGEISFKDMVLPEGVSFTDLCAYVCGNEDIAIYYIKETPNKNYDVQLAEYLIKMEEFKVKKAEYDLKIKSLKIKDLEERLSFLKSQ